MDRFLRKTQRRKWYYVSFPHAYFLKSSPLSFTPSRHRDSERTGAQLGCPCLCGREEGRWDGNRGIEKRETPERTEDHRSPLSYKIPTRKSKCTDAQRQTNIGPLLRDRRVLCLCFRRWGGLIAAAGPWKLRYPSTTDAPRVSNRSGANGKRGGVTQLKSEARESFGAMGRRALSRNGRPHR